jgi:hypothetical protein
VTSVLFIDPLKGSTLLDECAATQAVNDKLIKDWMVGLDAWFT